MIFSRITDFLAHEQSVITSVSGVVVAIIAAIAGFMDLNKTKKVIFLAIVSALGVLIFISAICYFFTPLTITLDPSGGIVSSCTITVSRWGDYKSLPTPQMDYYTFDGWYTSVEGGSLITNNTRVDNFAPNTLYAHWKHNEVSDWTDSSEVPNDVEIVEQKWTYIQTENKNSENPNESGWILVGSDTKMSSSGTHTYAEFPVNSDGYEYYNISDQYYQKYNVGAFTDNENEYTKREITDEQITSYIYYHWVYPLEQLGEGNREIGEFRNKLISNGGEASHWESFENGYIEYKEDAKAYRASGHSDYSYWWNGRIPVYTQTYTDYVKIYHYIKENHLDSSTEIKEGGNISNVQKFVKYRPK